MPVMSRKCKPRWTAFLQPATTSASPSALKRSRWCSSQPQATSTISGRSQWTDRLSRWTRPLPTLAAPSLAQPPSMLRSTIESPRQAAHSEDWGRKSGRGGESALRPNWKSTEQLSSPPYSMAQKPGLCTDGIKDPQPLPLQMSLQPLSHPLAGQSPQYRGFAAGNFPSITTITHKAQLRWAGHVSRMPDNRIPKQLFSGELSHGKCKGGGQRKRFKDSLSKRLQHQYWVLGITRLRQTLLAPPHHQRSQHNGRAQDPPSWAEESWTQGQSHQHCQHDTCPLLPNLWERLHQPPLDTPKQLY